MQLGDYLSAIVPQNICSWEVFRNRARWAQKKAKPELPFSKMQLSLMRQLQLEQFAKITFDRSLPEQIQLNDFLEAHILAVATATYPDAEVNLQLSLQTIADLVNIDYRELIGEQAPPKHMRQDYIELLGSMLVLKEEDYHKFNDIVLACWERKDGRSFITSDRPLSFPALPRMLRFLRKSSGNSQKRMGSAIGISQSTIAQSEIGNNSPSDETLKHCINFFSLSKESITLLKGAVPAARAYASKIRPFNEPLSDLVTHYGSKKAFLKETGLAPFITEDQMERLLQGVPPGSDLTNYLGYFVTSNSSSYLTNWWTSVANAKILSSESPIEFRSGDFGTAQEDMLKRLASTEYTGNELPALPRMLRFLRQSHGLTREEWKLTAEIAPHSISSWEHGTKVPSEKILLHYINYFSLSERNKTLLKNTLPGARAYASEIKPFAALVLELMNLYDSREIFLEATGLDSFITKGQIERLLQGAPPGKNLADYLSYFVPFQFSIQIDNWEKSATIARTLSNETPIEFSDGDFQTAQTDMLKHLATAGYAGDELPALPRMLRFLRQSNGITREKLGLELGVAKTLIAQWESAIGVPTDKKLQHYMTCFSLSEADKVLFENALPAARAYASKVKSFSRLLSESVNHYGSIDAFLEQTNLIKFITVEQVGKLQRGVPPGKNLANYLSYFAPFNQEQIVDRRVSAANARILSNETPIEFSDGDFETAQTDMLKRLATAEYTGDELPALPRMLRFLRQTNDMPLESLAKKIKLELGTLQGWESGREAPRSENLQRYIAFFTLDDVNKTLLEQALPVARAYASKVKPFHQAFSELVEYYENRGKDFLEETGLKFVLSTGQVELLRRGTPPGDRLAQHLIYFVPPEIVPSRGHGSNGTKSYAKSDFTF